MVKQKPKVTIGSDGTIHVDNKEATTKQQSSCVQTHASMQSPRRVQQLQQEGRNVHSTSTKDDDRLSDNVAPAIVQCILIIVMVLALAACLGNIYFGA